MKIRKVTEDELDYVSAICLDPSISAGQRKTMQDAMTVRTQWIRKMMRKGLQILVALEKPRREIIHYKWHGNITHADLAVHGNVPKGALEFIPIEHAPEPVKGEDSLFIDCVWVLPPFWYTGVAKGLMKSFIHEAKQCGGASVLTYEGDKWFGTSIKYMPSSFFKRFGFKEVARDGSRVLLYLDLGADKPPALIFPKTRQLDKGSKIVMNVFYNSQCPWSKWMTDKIEENMKKHPDFAVNTVNTDDREQLEEFGVSRGVCINGKPIINRMASWKEIQTAIEKICPLE